MPAGRPVVCITQARINSTRLPAKVLLPIAGKPLLWWHLDRLKRACRVDRIVVATTGESAADAIAAIAEQAGVLVFRGSEDDVLDRFAGAAALAGAATVVRVTSDCPVIDPALIDRTIALFEDAGPDCHYASLDVGTFPRGLDCEVFSRRALDQARHEATAPDDREHVTPFIRRDVARYGARFLSTGPGGPVYRWCVDTQADFDLVSRIIGHFSTAGVDFSWTDIANLMRAHPEWAAINAHVMQKPSA
ncbi:MAG TPA: glycosyltransferase family protein [Aliidongia sp.]|uniref:glycosyltransferase family protein n=1 Tax=Aliidongia sp. TaxID=1914230 RepID=UPI002DDDAE3D|nr:glycosyltransferase family protein [Aliidongia sp.]HEV2673301.1 glycosyltransferase family protein [Aliidongia sp.]